jgi:hypothetical protein
MLRHSGPRNANITRTYIAIEAPVKGFGCCYIRPNNRALDKLTRGFGEHKPGA